MTEYTITFTRSARKDLEKLHPTWVKRIFSKIESLGNNPRPSGCKKLSGEKNLWRIRVGDYRVIFAVDDKEQLVDIVLIRHRKDAYQ